MSEMVSQVKDLGFTWWKMSSQQAFGVFKWIAIEEQALLKHSLGEKPLITQEVEGAAVR